MTTTIQANTFAEAGVALHTELLDALQAGTATPFTTTAGRAIITPTPLLIRVLRRTSTDFADVIVDGRCATGSSQVGSAAAIWIHHNAAIRGTGGTGTNSSNSSPATVTAVAAAGVGGTLRRNSSGVSSSSFSSTTAAAPSTANNNNNAGGITPLFHTEAALNECRNLLALYSFHCLLTASQLYNTSLSNPAHQVHAAADGRVRQLPLNATQWAPELSIIVAETEGSAEELLKLCRALAEACNVAVQISMAVGSKTPASLLVQPVGSTANTTAIVSSSSEGASKDTKAEAEVTTNSTASSQDEAKKKGTEWPYAASILITTTQSFLNWNLTTLLNTGVDVALAEESTETETSNKDSNKESKEKESNTTTTGTAAARTRRVFPHLASIVVEEIGRATTSGTASADKVLQQWRDVHAAVNAAIPRQHPRYCVPAHLLPHVLWICRGPVSRLPASLRHLLSRRNRRYYQLQPSTYLSSAAMALMPQPQEGLSTPAESLGIRLVLSQSSADKDAQLRRIVTDRSGLYHRVLVLTHNKEVPQLNTLITSWGVNREYSSCSGNNNNSNKNNGAAPTMTESSPNLVHSTRRMDSVVAQHQCHTSYLNNCEAAERATSSSTLNANASTTGDDEPASSPVVVTLVAWDAFTALDVMDVDVIVQYYPPQKSLTEQEWAEFIQLLHTTVDGEREIELSLRQNRNNKEDNIRAKMSQLMQSTTTGPETPASAASTPIPPCASPSPHRPLPVLVTLMVAADFTLTAYFLHQYLYSGATGSLTQAATSTSLASIAPVPGKPGLQEPLEHPMPVLDISPKHPYFIPLVCGHYGGAEWPEGVAGSPPKPRVTPQDSKSHDVAAPPLLTHLNSGEAVTIRNVLVAKLAKEQNRSDTARSPLGSSTNSPTAMATSNSAMSPILLLAQGGVAMNGGNSGKGTPASTAAAECSSNFARLLAKSGMGALTGGNANNNGGGNKNNNSSNNQRSHGAREPAASQTEMNTTTTTTASGNSTSGNKGSGNAQRSGNNQKGNHNKGGSGNVNNSNNVNNSLTTSNSAPPSAAAAAATTGNVSGGQTDSNKSPTTATTTATAKGGIGEKSGGGGGNKRRQRNNRGNNNNSNNNSNSKKAASPPAS